MDRPPLRPADRPSARPPARPASHELASDNKGAPVFRVDERARVSAGRGRGERARRAHLTRTTQGGGWAGLAVGVRVLSAVRRWQTRRTMQFVELHVGVGMNGQGRVRGRGAASGPGALT